MKKILSGLACFSLALSFSIHSVKADETIEIEIQSLIDDIKTEFTPGSLNAESLQKLRLDLLDARDIIKSASGSSESDPMLSCVSRDNDGREPYMVSITDSKTFEETRILGTVMSLAECQTSIKNVRHNKTEVAVCGSRDNDARNPYSITIFDVQKKTSKSFGVLLDLDQCVKVLDSAKLSETNMSVCVSRDNDARNPYCRMNINLDAGFGKCGSIYDTVDACLAN